MSNFKLIIVEDDEQEREAYRITIDVYQEQNNCKINLTECCSLKEAKMNLNNTFDGAIIDLKLGQEDGAGNEVTEFINSSFFKIPIAIYTGTPSDADTFDDKIPIIKKGEKGIDYILNYFFSIYKTGLTKIMGGKGAIEEALFRVYWDNIIPQLSVWQKYGEADPNKTEKALLRYTVNHLLQLMDKDIKFYPEEVYFSPPISTRLQTGSIVKSKESGTYSIILTPACDLFIRKDGDFKTDQIIVVDIEKSEQIIATDVIQDCKNESKQKKKLEEFFRNKDILLT